MFLYLHTHRNFVYFIIFLRVAIFHKYMTQVDPFTMLRPALIINGKRLSRFHFQKMQIYWRNKNKTKRFQDFQDLVSMIIFVFVTFGLLVLVEHSTFPYLAPAMDNFKFGCYFFTKFFLSLLSVVQVSCTIACTHSLLTKYWFCRCNVKHRYKNIMKKRKPLVNQVGVARNRKSKIWLFSHRKTNKISEHTHNIKQILAMKGGMLRRNNYNESENHFLSQNVPTNCFPMANYGQTCYLITAINALFQCPSITKYVYMHFRHMHFRQRSIFHNFVDIVFYWIILLTLVLLNLIWLKT